MSERYGRRPVISVIVPSIGRESLIRTIASVVGQAGSESVELIVVADTHKRRAPILEAANEPIGWIRWLTYDAGYSAWGSPQRNHAMTLARGAHLAFLDDDDIWSEHALTSILDGIAARPEALHLFQMEQAGAVLWSERYVRQGNVGTPMAVVPNLPDKLGVWGARYEGDFDFIRETAVRLGETVWHPTVIAHVRPNAATDWTEAKFAGAAV